MKSRLISIALGAVLLGACSSNSTPNRLSAVDAEPAEYICAIKGYRVVDRGFVTAEVYARATADLGLREISEEICSDCLPRARVISPYPCTDDATVEVKLPFDGRRGSPILINPVI